MTLEVHAEDSTHDRRLGLVHDDLAPIHREPEASAACAVAFTMRSTQPAAGLRTEVFQVLSCAGALKGERKRAPALPS